MTEDRISIGKDRWIEQIEIDTKLTPAELDDLMYSTRTFWDALVTECVVECCGIDALGLWPEDITKAAGQFDQAYLYRELSLLKSIVQMLDNDVVVVHRLNNYFHKSVFIKLLDHIISCITPST